MSIKFEKERKIFHLSTKDYSYYIHVNKLNYLIHLYDGKLIDDISKERASERYMERYAYVSEGKEVVDEIIDISSEKAIQTVHDLNKAGFFLGISSGAAISAARKIKQKDPKAKILAISPDGGEKYISLGIYDE